MLPTAFERWPTVERCGIDEDRKFELPDSISQKLGSVHQWELKVPAS
jgi:hypothetical protein